VAFFTRNFSIVFLMLAGCADNSIDVQQEPLLNTLVDSHNQSKAYLYDENITIGNKVVNSSAPKSYVQLNTQKKPLGSIIQSRPDPAKFTLDFVNADLNEVIRAAFEEQLRENYLLDPRVNGQVTIRTPSPLNRKELLTAIRALLKQNNAVMIHENGLTRIEPNLPENALLAPEVVFLSHVNSEKMVEAMTPFLTAGATISALHDGVIVSAPSDVKNNLVQAIRLLDQSPLANSSSALVPLRVAQAKNVASELHQLVKSRYGSVEQIEFMALPINRMNAILIASQSAEIIRSSMEWIRRLDQDARCTVGLHVVHVKNRPVEDLVTLLQGVLINTGAQSANIEQDSGVAPELTESTYSSADNHQSDLELTADTTLNAILLHGTTQQAELVRDAVRQLDHSAKQVLIEATIAEIALRDELSYGVRWFFESGNHGVSFTDSAAGAITSVIPVFNYLFTTGGAKVVLSALDDASDIEIISSPSLVTMDNRAAELQVGDETPVITRNTQSVTDPSAPIIQQIEYRQTGVLMTVTPHVSTGGIITLDIEQEVSDVAETSTSGIESPTIRNRRFQSVITLKSGETAALDGLIRQGKTISATGLPGLFRLPAIGALFGERSNKGERTELLVLIKAQIIPDRNDAPTALDELRDQLRLMRSVSPIYEYPIIPKPRDVNAVLNSVSTIE